MLILDAANPLELIKITSALPGLLSQHKEASAAGNALQLVSVAKQIAEVLRKLGEMTKPENESPQGLVTVDSGDELSDDPNSPNYRYADTGYIADSRKEKAASMIRVARSNGQRVRTNDVDWNAIEQNPRQAAELITKQNLFGKTDWERLQSAGMDPAAGFLIDKIFASVAAEPSESTPLARKDYAYGLESLRDRLEKCETVDDVLEVLSEIRGEIAGVQLTAEQADRVAKLREEYNAKNAIAKAFKAEYDSVFKSWQKITMELNSAKYENDKRIRRKWKPDPEVLSRIEELSKADEQAERAFRDYQSAHPGWQTKERNLGGGRVTYLNDLEWDAYQSYLKISEIEKQAKQFNLVNNQATRSWLTLGDKFLKLVHYRSFKGSEAFAGHVTNASAGKITDWSWSDKERKTQPKDATKTEINFQLRVAEKFERKGGRPVAVNSTKALQDMLGFGAVQSGNWVLKDPNSAKFHVEHTAGAMMDMADILGIDEKLLGFGGRLGMAFGARGSGGKNAPRAHYEPIHRAINLTKMGGGGELGHEYFHAIDNVLKELVTQKTGAKTDFVTKNPDLLPDGAIKDAVKALRSAMMDGNNRVTETLTYTKTDIRTAQYNIDSYAMPSGPARGIKTAGNATDAVLSVEKYFAGRDDKRANKARAQWKRIAAAYYHKGEVSDAAMSVDLPTGPAVSAFAIGAHELDGGNLGKYWSQHEEMAARAFQSYLEDKLADAGRKNDYLSAFADNKYHVDPLFGVEWKPYPEGDERKRINAAFDRLFDEVRKAKVFESAVANQALMDAIFGR